jgi:butyrate kinase
MVETSLNKMLLKKDFLVIGVVGRGRIVKPLDGGTYRINNSFLEDAKTGK